VAGAINMVVIDKAVASLSMERLLEPFPRAESRNHDFEGHKAFALYGIQHLLQIVSKESKS
jgi:hypothetical protein